MAPDFRKITRFHALYWLGIAAPILFTFTVLLGGALRPGYSHAANTMSELFSPGSPNRLLLSALYTIFGVSLSVFGFGLLQFVRRRGELTGIGMPAAVAFILVGILNILTATIFPQDAWGSTPTLPGGLHIVLHGVISLLSLLYIALFGIWFQRQGLARHFGVYSIATLIGAAIAAGWFISSYGNPLMGLAERVAALIGFQWTAVLAGVVLRND